MMRLKKWVMDSNEWYDSLSDFKRITLIVLFLLVYVFINSIFQSYYGVILIVFPVLITWRLSYIVFFDKNVNRKLYKRAKRL